jgi:hypothetical protein
MPAAWAHRHTPQRMHRRGTRRLAGVRTGEARSPPARYATGHARAPPEAQSACVVHRDRGAESAPLGEGSRAEE